VAIIPVAPDRFERVIRYTLSRISRTIKAVLENEREMVMNENDEQQGSEKGPTEKLRDQEKPEAEQLVPGTEVPGTQKPDSEEIKDEKGPNTE
jgi:hypothetical protein